MSLIDQLINIKNSVFNNNSLAPKSSPHTYTFSSVSGIYPTSATPTQQQKFSIFHSMALPPSDLQNTNPHLDSIFKNPVVLGIDYNNDASLYEEANKFAKKCYSFLVNFVPFEQTKIFVAGGFFPRFFHGLPIRDVDVYVNWDYEGVKRQYLDAGWEIVSAPTYNSNYCVLRSKDYSFTIDLVGFHEPKHVDYVTSFDIETSMVAVDSSFFYISAETFKQIKEKQLVFNSETNFLNDRFGNNTIDRMLKYRDLGFSVSHNETYQLMTIIKKSKSISETVHRKYGS
jgi:hypothetical protein